MIDGRNRAYIENRSQDNGLFASDEVRVKV